MSRYVPPHLRPSPPTRRSNNDLTTLASPSSDLKPFRPRPSIVNSTSTSAGDIDFEHLQSVSRSGGDGKEGDLLKDWTIQERYRDWIDTKVDKHYSTFLTPRHVLPKADATDERESLGSIVLLFRKLREGVVASHRIDKFAIEVFESSAKIALLARNAPQLVSSLSGLVPGLYSAYDDLAKTDNLTAELRDLKLDVEQRIDNRAEFANLLLLYHLVHSPSSRNFSDLYFSLTIPSSPRLGKPFSTDGNGTASRVTKPVVVKESVDFSRRAQKALSLEQFSPMQYFALLRDETATTYERMMLSWAEDELRERAWDILKKGYISVGVDWLSRCLGGGKEVERWVEEQGKEVVNGRVGMR